jgi:hypothetical protein
MTPLLLLSYGLHPSTPPASYVEHLEKHLVKLAQGANRG